MFLPFLPSLGLLKLKEKQVRRNFAGKDGGRMQQDDIDELYRNVYVKSKRMVRMTVGCCLANVNKKTRKIMFNLEENCYSSKKLVLIF